MQNLAEQQSPTCLASETSFQEDSFPTDQGNGDGFNITFTVSFISIIITLAPPETIRH